MTAVRALADYVIARHYPDLQAAGQPHLELLRAVAERQATLVACWMSVGFIHGVMNTDNMAVSGETIDFGPCAFMDEYDPAKVFSSIDEHGPLRVWQPAARGAMESRALRGDAAAADRRRRRSRSRGRRADRRGISATFQERWLARMRAKLGSTSAKPATGIWSGHWLELLQRNRCDFTLTFRRLCTAAGTVDAGADAGADAPTLADELRSVFARPEEYDAWATRWRARLAHEPVPGDERAATMRKVNPAYIPRNHRIEQALAAATERGDFAPFEETDARARGSLSRDQQEHAMYATAPRPEERVLRTFCGT